MATTATLRMHPRPTPAQEMAAAIDAFHCYGKAKNLSPKTLDYYGFRLKAFRDFLTDNDPDAIPASITPRLVRDFLTHETEHNSPATANHSFITLRAFFNYLVRDGFMESNPMHDVEKVRRKRTVLDTFTTEQIDALLATCGKDFVGVRDRAMMLLLFDCGLRVSELCGVTLDDIDWTAQTVLVVGKGNVERIVPFGAVARQALLAYISRRGEEVRTNAAFVNCYGDPLDRFRVLEIIKTRGETAKVTGVRCTPHTFRHTFAVMYLRNGGDVFSLQKLLGHTDLTMTRRYAELSQSDVVEKHRKFSPADALPVPHMGGRKRMK